ncbi:hypothetical protein BDM02DRAFT_3096198 [Thelephora ganbajun]|uniref:Uncharacterized protein n=1 Tax=Thelephora ganbajun TaxID=370292 RepID=A0ACB6ZG65_THEGA|nr:hypothetical protein BDM02DRAFT_3096198 [Thelephora ganbajun]
MSNLILTNSPSQQFSICPANGRQTVGDGAYPVDITPRVVAVCHRHGHDDLYYYSTTFSGGPEFGISHVRPFSGGFDVPTQKCPPDRGSLDWVTDSPASIIHSPTPSQSSLSSSHDSSYGSSLFHYPPTPPPERGSPDSSRFNICPPPPSVGPQKIVHKQSNSSGLVTPPLSLDESESAEGGVSAISAKQTKATLDLLAMLFPRSALSAMPYAQGVSISSPNLGTVFDGVILDLPEEPKTLYIDGKNAQHVNLRESIVALLDLADEQLNCAALVIALERSVEGLGGLLHSLMYVGGSVVTKPPLQVDPAYVLVGLEI